jgi:bacillithiol biosynthesis cysteine-adding enzyme BshC
MFQKTSIPLSATNQFSKLILNYIDSDDALKGLYEYKPNSEEFEKAISKVSQTSFNRQILTDALKAQYQKTNLTIPSCIDLLNDNNTFTVCTGHQLCLFTGPLYFLYKIISTINLAETLKKHYPKYNFIPVYWMASEDHDFEEIKSIHLFGKAITWNNDEAKGAVGDLQTNTMQSILDEVSEIMGDSDYAKELNKLFATAYLKHKTLADATRYLVNELFKNYPLLIVDGNDASLKSQFTSVIADDIFSRSNYQHIHSAINTLEKQGYKAQVNPREINCFYMTDHFRERIEFDASIGVYNVINSSISFTEEQLKQELKNNPQHFSPNVVLRPLYQQMILPNLAYVGGPGEIAYWLEYKEMFNARSINYPVLIPRHFAMIVEPKHIHLLEKFQLELADIFKDIDTLTKEYIVNHTDKSLLINDEEKAIENIFSNIIQKATTTDVSLKAFSEAELHKVLKIIKGIEAKMQRSEKQKQETALLQLVKLKEKYFPQRTMQERYDNFIPYYLKHGKNFVSALKDIFVSFEFELLILTENNKE